MKLFVCLFLIVLVIEEYNCAPYKRIRNRHKHHHDFQIGRSRQRSPYRSPYGPYTRCEHGYQSMYDMRHPWRDTRHCTWHGSRHSYRHCSRYGRRRGARFCYRYGFRFGKNNFLPNTTPMDKTEDKIITVEKPIDKVVEKTSEGTVYKSTENPIVKSTEQLIEVATKKTLEQPVEKSVEMVTEKLTEMLEVEPTEKIREMPADKSIEKSTLALTVAAAETVTMPEDLLQVLTLEELLDKLVEKPTENVSDTVLTDSDNNMYIDYLTVNQKIDDWPTEILSDISTESPFSMIKIQ